MRYLEGNKNLFMEDFKSAIDEFQKALDLFPEFEEAKEQLIEIYFNSKDYVQALAYLNQSKKYTDFMDSHNQIEGSMVNQSLKKQTRLGNDYIYRLLGIIYYQLHEYIKAIDNLNSALNSGLNNYEPPYYLGLCNIALGNNEEARLWFKKAVEKDGVEFFQKRLNEMEKTFKSSS